MESAIFFDKEKVDNLRRHVYNSMYVCFCVDYISIM